MQENKIKTIEQAEQVAINACKEKGINVGPDDVIEIEYKKRSSIWEVEFVQNNHEYEVKILGVDGRVISVERD